jgi:hypothetical protein
MQQATSTPGSIECLGSFVQFPIPAVTPGGKIPKEIKTSKSSIPLYVWLLFGIAALLLLLFVFMMAFVKK